MTNKIAIIPARGGSKRIPRKNIKHFLGKPIIAYSIETALKSNLFDEVMVSTDDEEIAEIAAQYGAAVPFLRSGENADDFASTGDVINEVLSRYKEGGRLFETGCCLYATAPFIEVAHLEKGYQKLVETGLLNVFPAVAFSYPIWRGVERMEHDEVKMCWPEYAMSRSQDLKKVYHDAGQWFWFKVTERKLKPFESSAMIELDEIEVQDIDNETDWAIAELKYKYLKSIK